MSGVLMLAQAAAAAELITEATAGQVTVLEGEQVKSPQIVAQHLAVQPELVLIDATVDPSEALGISGWVVERFGAPVVLISDDASLGLQAMRAGVRDMLRVTSSPGEARDAISRNRRLAGSNGDAVHRGRVVTVASPKGGVGKTTITTNIAVGLALGTQLPVVLVDLDLHFGDVASALNLEPEYTLPETARAALAGDPLALKPYLTRHETGLWVVAGSDDPVAADAVTAQEITSLLRTLTLDFAYVVVDTAPGLAEATLTALDLTSDLVLVTGLDVPGVRGLRKEIETLNELSMLMETRQIVLNFADPSRGLSVADVEATVRAKVDVAIPTAGIVPISVNQGIPLLQSRGNDKISRQLDQIVGRLVGRPTVETKRGLFSRRKESA
ncbi:AAA family ATPase [Aestuariimicrobium sp. T2.26MG-19.2B]|uniref:AAA family ATPase n=1 Tax=Aestuariimicrobium sp. T2.26MG-19.2B TaxID=3040679 RepID=UPI002477A60A|nr:P-loop NTPase [Aestuariimicrobium sp. T2.26MG-19.2B]CAI9406813.1 Iron-sulfur cluster carrier protein [Aestuariimicrobium sp. T2.26MG-19.2B]